MTDITIHVRKNDGLENYLNFFFFFFFFVFSHPGDSISLTEVRESGSIPGRLPNDPGGFTCMFKRILETISPISYQVCFHFYIMIKGIEKSLVI